MLGADEHPSVHETVWHPSNVIRAPELKGGDKLLLDPPGKMGRCRGLQSALLLRPEIVTQSGTHAEDGISHPRGHTRLHVTLAHLAITDLFHLHRVIEAPRQDGGDIIPRQVPGPMHRLDAMAPPVGIE